MFICGIGNFGHEHENEPFGSPASATRRSKRSTSFCRILGRDNSNKNPYADRGLDKFYALLADLDDKKQKLYTRMGSEDISFVRFVYANDSDHVRPIVVRVKEKRKEKGNLNLVKRSIKNAKSTNRADGGSEITSASVEEVPKGKLDENKSMKERCLRCKGSFRLESVRQPSYYFFVIVVLIMVLLAVYGRSFAILCTSIGWYLVPNVVGGRSSPSSSSSKERKPKRKEYLRWQSQKKINVRGEGPSSPRSVINGLTENNKTQRQQLGHRRSWRRLVDS